MVHGIVSNHGFPDGNKRTALYLVELLAQRSGIEFQKEDEAIVDTITSVAQCGTGYEDLAQWGQVTLAGSVPSGRPLPSSTATDRLAFPLEMAADNQAILPATVP